MTESDCELKPAATTAAAPPPAEPSAERRAEARRRTWKLGLLLLVPFALVGASSELQSWRGPYWLGSQSDPEYAYLLNSLRLVHGLPPAHIDHPGTPVQVLGAMVLPSVHGISDPFELTKDVIRDPETYLQTLRRCFAWAFAAVALAVGVLVYWKTNSVLMALCMQAAPFLSVTALLEVPRIKPEPLQIMLTQLLGLAVLLHVTLPAPRRLWLTAVACGGLVGLCVATKVTALPLAVVPLVVLPSHRSRLWFLAAGIAAFCVGIFPMLPHFHEFVVWIRGILTHQGEYGGGNPGFVDPAKLLRASKAFAFREPFVVLILAVSLWTSVHRLVRATSTSGTVEPVVRAMLAVALAQMLQLLIAAKMARYHYLVPAFMMAGLSLTLLVSIAIREGWARGRWRSMVLAAGIGGVAFVHGRELAIIRGWQLGEQAHQLAVQDRVLNHYKDWIKVEGYRSSSIPYALYHGDQFSGEFFYPWLRDAYPDPKYVYCDTYGRRFRSSRGPIDIERLMRTRRRIVIRGDAFLRDAMSAWELRNVFPGARESLYEWKGGLAAQFEAGEP